MPPTNNASTKTDLGDTDIDCSAAECNKDRANKLRSSKIVDDSQSELCERKLNLRLIQVGDAKTRFYTGLLDLIEKGDNIIMADRGFEIKELLSRKE